MDAFVYYRHQNGLPAAVIDIGLVGDMGYIMEHPTVYQQFQVAGSYFVGEKEVLASFQWAMYNSNPRPSGKESPGRLSMGVRSLKPLSSPANHLPWVRDRRMAIYRNIDVAEGTIDAESSDTLKHFISRIKANPSQLNDKASLDLVTKEIGIRIYSALLKPIEEMKISQKLEDLGVDSLVLMEIRNWSKRSFGGAEFSTLEFINAGTIEGLGVVYINALKKKYPPSSNGEKAASINEIEEDFTKGETLTERPSSKDIAGKSIPEGRANDGLDSLHAINSKRLGEVGGKTIPAWIPPIFIPQEEVDTKKQQSVQFESLVSFEGQES